MLKRRKKGLVLVLTIAILAATLLTGCRREFVFKTYMKNELVEEFNEKTYQNEIIDIEGMAYFRIDADYVQLVDIDGNPISYENGKSHSLLVRNLDFSDDNKGFTWIIEDIETGVKWLCSIRIESSYSLFADIILYESDTKLILGEDGVPKID